MTTPGAAAAANSTRPLRTALHVSRSLRPFRATSDPPQIPRFPTQSRDFGCMGVRSARRTYLGQKLAQRAFPREITRPPPHRRPVCAASASWGTRRGERRKRSVPRSRDGPRIGGQFARRAHLQPKQWRRWESNPRPRTLSLAVYARSRMICTVPEASMRHTPSGLARKISLARVQASRVSQPT